jgi:hypothetical protein
MGAAEARDATKSVEKRNASRGLRVVCEDFMMMMVRYVNDVSIFWSVWEVVVVAKIGWEIFFCG